MEMVKETPKPKKSNKKYQTNEISKQLNYLFLLSYHCILLMMVLPNYLLLTRLTSCLYFKIELLSLNVIDMVSSKIFTSVLVCGSVKQPCNPEPKGQSPGSHRPVLATTGTNPSPAAGTKKLPTFAGARASSCSSCWTKQEQGAGRNGGTPCPNCSWKNWAALRLLVGCLTSWGLLLGCFSLCLLMPQVIPREASHPSTGEALSLNRANTASLTCSGWRTCLFPHVWTPLCQILLTQSQSSRIFTLWTTQHGLHFVTFYGTCKIWMSVVSMTAVARRCEIIKVCTKVGLCWLEFRCWN